MCKCCEPGEYDEIEKIILWYIKNADSNKVKEMGMNGRKYLEKNLTKNVSVNKYIEEILHI